MVDGVLLAALARVTGPPVGDESLVYAVAFSLGTLVGVYALWNGSTNLWQGYRMWAAEPTPTTSAREATGDVEVRGTAAILSESLSGRYSNLPCLVQTWEKTKASAGDTPVADGSSAKRPLAAGREAVPFLVRDDSGTIAVDPRGASLSLDPNRSNTSHDIHQREARLEPGDDVYVFGQVCRTTETRTDLDGEPVYVGAGDDPAGFLIADSEPDEAVRHLVGTGALFLLAGLLVAGTFGVGTMAALGLG